MRVTRIHVPGPLAAATEISLPAQAGEHLTRVLRLEPGAAFVLFDGSGGEYTAMLGERSGKTVRARVQEHQAIERESPLDIMLLQGIARGERMDLVVQKATELGVSRIVPLIADRSVVKLDAKQRARKQEHWQAIVVSACEQCGRNRVPEVTTPCTLVDAIVALPTDSLRITLDAAAGQPLGILASRPGTPLALLVGPEGGLSVVEEKLALTHRFAAARLGPRVLRTETAGLAALAALQVIAGDFAS
jgi:16S rRNA (uracil1498-N3)-methyltransferase